MGGYMSSPNTDKESEDKTAGGLTYGVSSMQGWRIAQEDAHNCCPEFLAEKNAALFAVYDGHGGAEVAEYTAKNFPDFIKKLPAFQEGRYTEALQEAFLSFDATLIQDDVIKELKVLAQDDSNDEEAEEDEIENLQSEATMPLQQLLKKLRQAAAEEGEELTEEVQNGDMDTEKSEDVNGHALKDKGDSNGKGDADTAEPKDKSDSSDSVGGSTQNGPCQASDSSAGDSKGNSEGEPSTEAATAASSSSLSAEAGGSSGAAGSSSAAGSSAAGSSAAGSSAAGSSAAGSSAAGSSAAGSSAAGSSAAGGSSSKGGEDEESDESSMSDDDDSDDVDSDDSDLAEYKQSMEENGSEEEEDEDELEDITGGEDPGFDSGCTAVVALKCGTELYVANAGDSRCVVGRAGKAVDMSIDHKPEDEPEKSRIQKAGGWITPDGRVKGGLNLSRSLGDHTYKQNKDLPDREQMISALPDVKTLTLTDEDDFMVLACDGIWNVLSSQEVVTYVHDRLYGEYPVTKLSLICEELFDTCLAPDTTGDGTGCDNMTCMIIKFRDRPSSASASSSSSALKSGKRPASEERKEGGDDADADDEKSTTQPGGGMDTSSPVITQDKKRTRRDDDNDKDQAADAMDASSSSAPATTEDHTTTPPQASAADSDKTTTD